MLTVKLQTNEIRQTEGWKGVTLYAPVKFSLYAPVTNNVGKNNFKIRHSEEVISQHESTDKEYKTTHCNIILYWSL